MKRSGSLGYRDELGAPAAGIADALAAGSMPRREFLQACARASVAAAAASWLLPVAPARAAESTGRPKKGLKGKYDLAVVKGSDPAVITRKAVDAMGGMNRFVKKGATVVIKPNMAWDRTPEQAGNTNPAVVAALVEMCFAAGAKRVNVFDRPCDDAKKVYDISGIRAAAEAKGAKVFFVDDWNSVKMNPGHDSPMKDWPVFKEAVECDTFINVPVLKHHGLTKLTISMKNMMGVCLGNRGKIHDQIGRNLVDVTDFISPDLTVVDAYRVLKDNGPSGGNLADVEKRGTVMVGTDPALSDAYAARFMGVDPMTVQNIAEAASRKYGSVNIESAKIYKKNA